MDPTGTPAPSPPVIGDPAPLFRARSTMGEINLSDYQGHWVLLFGHPADFTPVCSTEFVEFARRQPEFEALDCKLIGLSVDSLHAHLAWVTALREVFGAQIGFPLIEDPTMAIARAYGMIDAHAAGSATVRSTFFIDPVGTIRAITAYPADVGRSVSELLRLLRAMRKVSSEPVLAPEGWDEGRPLLAPAADRPGQTPDWFCRFEDRA